MREAGASSIGLREGPTPFRETIGARREALLAQGAALKAVIGEVDRKLEAARRAGVADNLLAPVEIMLRQVLATVRGQDNRATIERLEGELAALGAKAHLLTGGATSPETLERIQKQTEEIRDLLAAAAKRPSPQLRLERCLRALADRIERLTTSANPHTETLHVVESLSHARSEIERSASPTWLAAIEGLLDRLATRVNEALQRQRLQAKGEDPADLPMDAPSFEGALKPADSQLQPSADVATALTVTREPENRSSQDTRALAGALRDLVAHLENLSKREVDLDSIRRVLNQIVTKMDALAGSAVEPRIERAIGEVLRQFEATQRNLQVLTSSRSSELDLAREFLDWRAEQRQSERRTLERLADVQSALARLLARTEAAAAPAEDGVSPHFDSSAIEERLREIPDRAPQRPEPPAPTRMIDASSVLLEPRTSVPLTTSHEEDSLGALPRPGIGSHIAAARRAAQVALVETASRKLQLDPALPAAVSSAPRSNAAGRARGPGRRRVALLALVLLGSAASAAAMMDWRDHWPQVLRRLQVPAVTRFAGLPWLNRTADVKAKSLGTIDFSPVGGVAPQNPKTSVPPARSAPADLIAALPASLPQSLRDQAASGDPAAETELALRYLDGRAIPKDPASAARWLELAAVQGLPIAQYRIATLYEKGNGVARDPALARSWYLKAATAGNARAMHNLGVLIAQDPHDGKPDYAEAAHWFRQAGELGVRDSQFNLGVLYGRGLGVPQDLGQSWLWFSLAARQGDTDAAAKRDEVAAKLDANAQAAASQALAEFKTQAPSPAANEAPAPVGGWQGGTNEPAPVPSTPPTARDLAAPGASG